MICPRCQFDNREGAKFCEECGAELGRKCPRCDAEVGPRARFCAECGHELAVPPVAPPSPTPASYTPKHLADKILAARPSIEGERKQVTVLFADVTGFTSISEKLDPEEVHGLIRQCLDFFTEEIHRYEGTIAQFLGDGVMALFGAPIAHEDAPQRALYAALGIQQRLRRYGDRLREEGIEFKMRIGLNTGLVVVGKIGDDLTMEYTAMGDTVNLASRMEHMAEPGTIQVTENTYRLTEGYFEFKPLGEVEVMGKREPVRAYQVLGVGPVRSRLEAAMARGLTEFVGRGRELEHLADCFARVRAGQGQVVGIVGEAGVGKSRIVLEFRKSIEREDFGCLEGTCLSYGQSMPYLPFIEILKGYFGIEDGDRAFAVRKKVATKAGELDSKLGEVVPFLCDLLSVPVDDPAFQRIDAEKKRKLTFDAVKALFLRASQERPLIIVVDNLQWVDKASAELLTYVVEGIAGARILLLCVYRPGFVHQWSGKSYYSQVTLNPLPDEEIATLARLLLDTEELTSDLRRLVLGRAEGNPLYVEEIVHWLLETDTVARTESGCVLKGTPSEVAIPHAVQEVIMARIDRLETELKQTVQTASVIGRDFLFRLLRQISEKKAELENYLPSLQALEFIYEKAVFPEPEYTFKHILVRDVAYESLLIKTRTILHGRIGKAMEELYGDRLDEHYEKLAYHYQRSDNKEKAIEYLVLAARKAAGLFANDQAIAFYNDALEMLEKLPATEENQRLREDIEFRLLTLRAISAEIPPF